MVSVIEDHLEAGAPDGVNPFAEFQAYAVHEVHREEIIDFFAGRVYGVSDDTSGLVAIRKLASKGRERLARETVTAAV